MENVIDIYERARVAYTEAPACQMDTTLDSFIQELMDLDVDITFGEAADLDDEFFGVRGGYWLNSYETPKVGEYIQVPYETSFSRQVLAVEVIHRGLLTMKTARAEWNA